MLTRLGWFFDADSGGAGGGDGSGDPGQGGDGQDEGLVYETWIGEQPEEVRTLLENHTQGLRSALQNERESRRDLERQLRELAQQAEQGSEAQNRLTQMADQVAESERRADFYEQAQAAGVSNLRLAYTVAVSDEMFDRRGNVNFQRMKEQYPELFGAARRAGQGNAGDGTTNNQPPARSMNDFIRRAAGRG